MKRIFFFLSLLAVAFLLPQAEIVHNTLPKTIGVDKDGIDDNPEKSLPSRYRPYFLFSDNGHGGEDNFRPRDTWFYVRRADLHTDGDEDGKYGEFGPITNGGQLLFGSVSQ